MMTMKVNLRGSIHKTVLFLLVIVSNSSLSFSQITAQNAKFFQIVKNGNLEHVATDNFKNSWSEIVEFSNQDDNYLLFYNRNQGAGKVFSYNEEGQMTNILSMSNWQNDWDTIESGNFGKANVVF